MRFIWIVLKAKDSFESNLF